MGETKNINYSLIWCPRCGSNHLFHYFDKIFCKRCGTYIGKINDKGEFEYAKRRKKEE